MIPLKRSNIDSKNLQLKFQNNYSGLQELIECEKNLTRYNMDIFRKLFEGLDYKKESKVIDFGAGIGTLAEIWRSEVDVSPICIEIDRHQMKILTEKGFETYSSIKELPSKISYIYTSNVLEHIEDDIKVLKAIQKKMSSGGRIAIYVPALPILFSDLDIRVGHFRRYKRKELTQKMESAGFHVECCYFNDSLGVLASIGTRLFGYKNRIGLGSSNSLKIYDKFFYPISIQLDRIVFKKIIGKNLLLIAVKIK